MFALVDARYIDRLQAPLRALGYEAVPSAVCRVIEEPASCHPDMAVFPIGSNEAIVAPELFEPYRAVLGEKGIKVVQGTANLSRKYPTCAAYNVANTGRTVFCHEQAVDGAILRWCREKKLWIVPVRQGYAKCSTCIVSENAIISADRSICQAARQAGLEVLEVSPGSVELPGYPYGFLGGASGLLRPGLLAFAGDIRTHPDGERIVSFCHRMGVQTVSLLPGNLLDIGSILPFGDEPFQWV